MERGAERSRKRTRASDAGEVIRTPHDVDDPQHFKVGELLVSHRRLVRILGPPSDDCDPLSIDAVWRFRFADGEAATIYNWKDGVRYLGPAEGTPVPEIIHWHVSGTGPDVLRRVHALLRGTTANAAAAVVKTEGGVYPLWAHIGAPTDYEEQFRGVVDGLKRRMQRREA